MCSIDEEQPGFIERIASICERLEELDPETITTLVDQLENAAPEDRPTLVSSLLQLADTDLEQRHDDSE